MKGQIGLFKQQPILVPSSLLLGFRS